MRKLLINNELFFAEDDEAVIDVVEQHMGTDTADALREILLDHECGGECDEVYRIGDHYKRVIQSALHELNAIVVRPGDRAQLDRITRALTVEL